MFTMRTTSRLSIGSRGFGRSLECIRKEFADKDYSLLQRLRLFDSVVTPTMLYGSGSWVRQRKMLRAIIGKGRRVKEASEDSSEAMAEELEDDEQVEKRVQWIRRVTHDALESMKKVGIYDWVNEQRRRVWRWAGHVARRTDGR